MSGGQKITDISHRGAVVPDGLALDASYASDDADFDQPPLEEGGLQWKAPVWVATTAAITISTALNAGDVLDGVTLVAGDRVLVKDQGTASENGIYVVDASPYRAADLDEDDEVLGAVVFVIDGTHAGQVWGVTNTTATIVDTDAIDWAQVGVGGLALSTATPIQDGGAGDDGVATDASKGDHKHPGDAVAIVCAISGSGSAITTGAKGFLKVPFACTITESEIEADVSANATMTIKKRAYGGGAAASIVAAAKPTLAGATENKDSTLTGWTLTIAAGEKLYWEVDTNDAATILTSTLTATRT